MHGDDFLSTGTGPDLEWFRAILERSFKIKTNVIGPGQEDDKELKILNRVVRFTGEGVEYEGDIRHAEIIVKQLGLHTDDC